VEVVVGNLRLGLGCLQFPLEPFEVVSVPKQVSNDDDDDRFDNVSVVC
jgi:hypothetical protein